MNYDCATALQTGQQNKILSKERKGKEGKGRGKEEKRKKERKRERKMDKFMKSLIFNFICKQCLNI